MLGDLRAVG